MNSSTMQKPTKRHCANTAMVKTRRQTERLPKKVFNLAMGTTTFLHSAFPGVLENTENGTLSTWFCRLRIRENIGNLL
eukprot:2988407-Amphidinium_carterae.1